MPQPERLGTPRGTQKHRRGDGRLRAGMAFAEG